MISISGTPIKQMKTENLICMTTLYMQNSQIKKINLTNVQSLLFVDCSNDQEITVNARVAKRFYDVNGNRVDEQGRRLDDDGNLIQ